MSLANDHWSHGQFSPFTIRLLSPQEEIFIKKKKNLNFISFSHSLCQEHSASLNSIPSFQRALGLGCGDALCGWGKTRPSQHEAGEWEATARLPPAWPLVWRWEPIVDAFTLLWEEGRKPGGKPGYWTAAIDLGILKALIKQDTHTSFNFLPRMRKRIRLTGERRHAAPDSPWGPFQV